MALPFPCQKRTRKKRFGNVRGHFRIFFVAVTGCGGGRGGSIDEGRVAETATPTAVVITYGSSGRLCHPTFASPLPPPTRRGRKRLRLRRGFGLSAAAGTALPALRATSPRGEVNGRVWNPPLQFKLRSINAVRAAAHSGPRYKFRIAPPLNAVGAASLGRPRFDDLWRHLYGITFQISCRGGF